ncbi:MAG: hypothetical protein J6C17_02015 [Clostridia bacterium]|nr:hypothetical protein [Clostridia bacterium]
MKKTLKVLLVVLLVVAVALGWFLVNNRDYIKALFLAEENTGTEISTNIGERERRTVETLGKYVPIKEIKEESGEYNGLEYEKQSVENIKSAIDYDSLDNIQAEITKYILRLYELKSEYLGRAEALIQKAKSEFYSLPADDRNVDNRTKIILKYSKDAYSALAQCDSEVNKICNSLEKYLKDNKADTSIVSEIKKAYEEEKTLKKAYYINKYIGE